MEKNYDNAAADIAYVRSELSRLVKDPELSAILGDEAVERMSKWDSVIGQKMDQPFSLMSSATSSVERAPLSMPYWAAPLLL